MPTIGVYFHTCDHFLAMHTGFLAIVQAEVEPTRLSETVKHAKWRTTMQ